ncbi:MoaA/NifB/PqqE/SkfB family radical SAM enzyme [Anaerosolibacter carboniphilus]|uniref:MoaA/NifB/PqqE/SkfB family radical SAM enzyme n=1 Tax=Anaerosolibacter carboniphilus TaxID=1417629 RepID=A0A841KW41_9FIRM|nr:radical SAM protein [Anaerosolibacter carboniphilus]MBB6217854.1 MoaA/NifB/PqqE/SkfB family radical SAM enzyme [Anaerosolibacter carboniphilus]
MEFPDIFTFNKRMNEGINRLLENILKENLRSPSQVSFLLKTIASQRKAARRREEYENQGLHIPAFMIASITHRCNLRCAGCYAHAQHRNSSGEIAFERLKTMVGEARELGISFILLAGGEPLVRKHEIMDIANSYSDIIFPVFTNGLMIDDELVKNLRSLKNIVPVISIEGLEEDTDHRRGDGVYKKLKTLFKNLQEYRIFYGCAITVTSSNLNTVTNQQFIRELLRDRCKLFFFIEYVPVEAGTEHLILSDDQKQLLMERLDILKDTLPASFIAFPGDEQYFGGCIASGRGFVHISPDGSVEPCPFAPFSDSNLRDKTLKECLESDYLKRIRENHELLVENQGGCALWENRELIKSYLAKG